MTAISRSTQQRLATEAARQKSETVRAELKKTRGCFPGAARLADQFERGQGAKRGASLLAPPAVASGGISASLSGARIGVAQAGAMIAEGAAMVRGPRPDLSKVAEGIADGARRLANDPGKAFGPFMVDLDSLVAGAKSVVKTIGGIVDTAESVVTSGLELIKSGAEKLGEIATSLDQVKEVAIDEVTKRTIDVPIDALNSEGDSAKITVGLEALIPTPVPDLKVKGAGEFQAEVKQEPDGGYTVTTELNGSLGAALGVEDARGNSASGDLSITGGGKVEFKVEPVKGPDGEVDVEATKRKVKELTEGLARQVAVGSMGTLGGIVANKLIGPTEAQLETMRASLKALELKGGSALNLAGKLNLPIVSLDGTARVQQDLTLRYEPAKDGKPPAIVVKNTLGGEAELHGAGTTNAPGKQRAGVVKGQVKVEFEQRFEFPGTNGVADIVANAGKLKPVVSQQLTLSTDVAGGYGTQHGGDTGAVDAKYRDTKRGGFTTEVKIIAPKTEDLRQIVGEALKGNLGEAAKKAGEDTQIELKTTVYTERQRQVVVNAENESVGGIGGKADFQERDVRLVKEKKTTPMEIARTVQEQLEELERMQRPALA